MLTIAWLIIATFFMIFNIVKGRIVYDYLVDSRKVNQYLLALYKVKIFQKIVISNILTSVLSNVSLERISLSAKASSISS